MTSEETRKIALAGLYADRAKLWGAPTPAGDDVRERGVLAWKPSRWFGRPLSAAESRALSRALEGLERDGLVKLIRGKRRLTAVRLLCVQTMPQEVKP